MDTYYGIYSDDGFAIFTEYDKAVRAMSYFPDPEWQDFDSFEEARNFVIDEYNFRCESKGNNDYRYTGQMRIFPNNPVFKRELKKKGGTSKSGRRKKRSP